MDLQQCTSVPVMKCYWSYQHISTWKLRKVRRPQPGKGSLYHAVEERDYFRMQHRTMPVDLHIRFPICILQKRMSQLCHWNSGVQGTHVPVHQPRWMVASCGLSTGCRSLHIEHGRMSTHTDVRHGPSSCLGFGSTQFYISVLLTGRRVLLEVASWIDSLLLPGIMLAE